MRISTNTVYAILSLVSLASAAPLSDVEPHSIFNSSSPSNSLETRAPQKLIVTRFTKAGNQKVGQATTEVRTQAENRATSFIQKWKPRSQLEFPVAFPFTGFDVDGSVHFDIKGDPPLRACEPRCQVTVHVENGEEVGSVTGANGKNLFET